MKRSKFNEVVQYTIDALKKAQFPLPPFAYYTTEDWRNLPESEIELVENMLGWDITDFGSGDFDKVGLTIFTFRNGNFYAKDKYPKPYCEKMLYVMDGQILPFHYHWYKILLTEEAEIWRSRSTIARQRISLMLKAQGRAKQAHFLTHLFRHMLMVRL